MQIKQQAQPKREPSQDKSMGWNTAAQNVLAKINNIEVQVP
jgi:hypothetical protein